MRSILVLLAALKCPTPGCDKRHPLDLSGQTTVGWKLAILCCGCGILFQATVEMADDDKSGEVRLAVILTAEEYAREALEVTKGLCN